MSDAFDAIRHTPYDDAAAAAALDAAAAAAAASPDPRAARRAIGLVDLTTLTGTDTDDRVRDLCARALAPGEGLPHTAAVCVFPAFVPTARRALGDGPVKLATVAGGFPHGQLPLDLRLAEVRRAVEDGADEIDMVIRRGRFLAGDWAHTHDEVAAHREAAGGACLKVILETGELGDDRAAYDAARIALAAGAPFVKTSTGKVQPAATWRSTVALALAVRDHAQATGHAAGLKPAGGLRTTSDAQAWMALVSSILGDGAIGPTRLRFGASSLLDALIASA